MSKRITYYQKKLADTSVPPMKCTDSQLKKIMETYSDLLSAMAEEDGYVSASDRLAKKVDPWFIEAEKRGID